MKRDKTILLSKSSLTCLGETAKTLAQDAEGSCGKISAGEAGAFKGGKPT